MAFLHPGARRLAEANIMRRMETKASSSPAEDPRILMVTPRYAPLIGGVENHVAQVARRLLRAGISITVLTTDPIGSLPKREQIDGVDVRRVRSWPSNSDLHLAPGLPKVITDGPWGVIHVQSYHTFVAPLAMAAALHASIPYVVTFHGGGHSSRLRNLVRRPQRALLRPLLARADRLIAVARFETELKHEIAKDTAR